MDPKKPHFEKLKEKWTDRHRDLSSKLWSKHKDSLEWLGKNTKHVAVGSLASLLLLSSPARSLLPSPQLLLASEHEDIDKGVFVVSDLANLLPKEIRPLTAQEEGTIAKILTRDFGVAVIPEVDGKRLDRSYGIIGKEQHLARYPGDTILTHFDSQDEYDKFSKDGMAGGLGAWGYFSNSSSEFTEVDKSREKYYVAVQTFLAPNFNERVAEYRDFFKFRKMLLVNPQNGKAVVAVIGDAGPAVWTGKHLGGSPEVMDYLERQDGSQRGPVLYFFIDDKEDKVPLGPISVK